MTSLDHCFINDAIKIVSGSIVSIIIKILQSLNSLLVVIALCTIINITCILI